MKASFPLECVQFSPVIPWQQGELPMSQFAANGLLGQRFVYTGSTSDRRHYTRDATMKNGARVILMVLGALVSDFHHPASAQSSVGGPKKQISVGGAAKQSSPVVPANKGGSISISQPSHPISAPAQPISAKPSHLISAPAQPKCPAGPCVAKKAVTRDIDIYDWIFDERPG
jgi:hypothetical protein